MGWRTVQRYTRNVKRWRGGAMVQRWVAAASSMHQTASIGSAATETCRSSCRRSNQTLAVLTDKKEPRNVTTT